MSNSTSEHAAQWLSRGVEELFQQVHLAKDAAKKKGGKDKVDPSLYKDLIIVGSGYGGAIAAATLAGAQKSATDDTPVTVCVLERGNEYLPGAFPSDASALPGHVRWSSTAQAGPQGNHKGLFDLRLGPDLNALVANGLGGGSLINAGVMLQPDAAALARLGLDYPGIQASYDDARALLDTPATNTIARHPDHGPGKGPLKFAALEELANTMRSKTRFQAVPISVAMESHTNSAGNRMDACIQCGDCATGCNHNAKLSLDTNLLVKARRQGAEIYTGATVLKIEPVADGWCLHVVYTDETRRRRHPSPYKLYAHKVILAAGTFGSTEILLRSRSDELILPKRLGQGFSSNGDMIAVAYDYPRKANAVADERVAPEARAVGPTITGRIDTTGRHGSQLCFQEMAVPAALRRVFEEMTTTAKVLHHMGRIDWSTHTADGPDPCAVSARAIGHSSILAAMGDDGAAGELELVAGGDADAGDGAICVRWPALRTHRLFEEQIDAIPVAENQTVLPNPVWRLLPRKMEKMIVAKRGPLTTVHPLGGCPIGKRGLGVVDEHGCVWLDEKDRDRQGSLVVLDGSILPGALGVNPALTIAALSLRAARQLLTDWKWEWHDMCGPRQPRAIEEKPLAPCPRRIAPPGPLEPAPTAVEVVERLGGEVMLRRSDGRHAGYWLELTIRYAKRDVAELALPQDGKPVQLRRTQYVNDQKSTVELYHLDQWQAWKDSNSGRAPQRLRPIAQARLEGTLDFMQREPSRPWRRIVRGSLAWWRNRGFRDTWQQLRLGYQVKNLLRREKEDGNIIKVIWRWLNDLAALASRAGEVRLFDYQLRIGAPLGTRNNGMLPQDACIRGFKRVTYGCLSNPVTQLTTLTLTEFPAMGCDATLNLDTDFLVEENAPLLRIVQQQDQPAALLDLLGLGGFLARVMLNVHLWTFRKPDPPRARTAQLLPGVLKGLPAPQVADVLVDQLADGTPVYARLTRYHRADTRQRPIVLIHGYSTSGTSFAHPKVKPNLASHLWEQGRDVWVLDLRTSSGMPFARMPWSFEDVALADIPAAIDHVCRVTKRKRLDIMAHCMGGAMTGMAVLAQLKTGERFYRERELLPKRIRRLVLSQVGPLVVFTQANVFRAFLMNYIRGVLPRVNYTFRVEGEPTLGDELLDRLLSAMPYPRHELAIENPWWPWANTEFAGTRHRMDALYGRDFSLANVDRNVLDNLDDFFGPLNLATVSQSIHFARRKTITNRAGRNVYVSRDSLKKWTFPTLSIHGQDNGLSSVATLGRMAGVLRDAGCNIHTHAFPGFGHQDSWLGRHAIDVFQVVGKFLSGPAAKTRHKPAKKHRKPNVQIPAAGPIWTGRAHEPPSRSGPGDLFSLIGDPALPCPTHVLCVPVKRHGKHFVCTDRKEIGLVPWEVDPDNDGWMKVLRRPASIGPAGTLVLIVYNDSVIVGHSYRDSNPVLFHQRIVIGDGPLLQLQPALDAGQKIPPGQDTLDLLNWATNPVSLLRPPKISKEVLGTVDDMLASMSIAECERGVLAAPHPTPKDSGWISFAVGSCQYPPGLLDSVPAYRSYERLSQLLKTRRGKAVSFVVLAGDQIYSDATAGLFDPGALDDRYKRPYEKLFSNKHVRDVLRRRPAYMMLDDHEISDNWEPESDQAARDANEAALAGFRKYQRAKDGPVIQLWYTFKIGKLNFFMGDTRSERDNRAVSNIDKAAIMSEEQMSALLTWLKDCEGPKFLVTPSVLGLRRRDLVDAGPAACLTCDGWQGYPASMQRLLAFICLNNIENVVFLSGDEHLSCDMTLTLSARPDQALQVRSIHASPLYAPYPFANSRQEDFVPSQPDNPDRFSFDYPNGEKMPTITCEVVATFNEGEGFAILTVGPSNELIAQFDRERCPTTVLRPAPVPCAPRQTPPRSDSAPPACETPPTDGPSPSPRKAASPVL
jgi:cholesterol oxidase